jgi:hypothetical protein
MRQKWRASLSSSLPSERCGSLAFEQCDEPHRVDLSPDELRSLAGRADFIASSVERLANLSNSHQSKARNLAKRLRSHSFDLEGWAAEGEPSEPDADSDGGVEGYSGGGEEPVAAFDISMLFSEL